MTRSAWLQGSVSLFALAGALAPVAVHAQAADASAAASEVVITGSRVIKNGNASPTPVTVVTTQALLEAQPGPVGEAIAFLPAFAGSRTGEGNPGSGTTNAAANSLNLRYLGYLRTLVLFDGKRVAPSTFDQVVDIDMIPQMLLQRVDLVTGGVSAVYGSDAVAGVVNFVTDTKFNGLKLDVEGGISQQDDDPTWTAGIAAGQRVGDKGHVEFSYQFHDDEGLGRRSDRQWGRDVWSTFGVGTAAAPVLLIENSRVSTASFGGLVTATGAGAALNNMSFDTNGVLSPFNAGTPTTTKGVSSGGDGYYNDSSIKAKLQTQQLFGRFDYDFTDALHGYVEGTYNLNKTDTHDSYNLLTNTVLNGTNPYLTPNYQFSGTFKLNEAMSDLPRVETNTTQHQYFIIAGLDGKLADWKWDVAINQANSSSTTTNPSQIDAQKLYASLDAVRDSSGNIVCHVSITNPGLLPGCAPFNPFGPTAASQAAINYVLTPSSFNVVNGMTDLTASISGSPFTDWAGPVQFALSGEWRRQTLQVSSSALPTDVIPCTGLTANCVSTGAGTPRWLDSTLANLPQVSDTVGEAAAEIDVPLLKDVFLFKDLSFNGAARFTDYNTSGKAWTWKLGLSWQVNDEIKLRGTSSRDIRAPNLYDLYQPRGVSNLTQTDLLTNTQYVVPDYSGGNPNLTPETSNTVTAGVVYSPEWLPRFSISADAYRIDVTNALISEDGANTTTQQVCNTSQGVSPLCALMTRTGGYVNTSPSNVITAFYAEQINIAELLTYGVDFEANYARTVAGNPLNLRALLTLQPHLIQYIPATPPSDSAGAAFAGGNAGGAFAVAQARAVFYADYTAGPWKFTGKERWRSAMSLDMTPGLVYATPQVAAAYYTDINVAYRMAQSSFGASELFVNVQNLFNADPPPAGRSTANRIGSFGGYALGDDPIGRYFTVGLRFRH